MATLRISEGFITVSELKAQATDWLRKLGEGAAPMVVTQHGKPAGVLLSPQDFDELTERARFVAAVESGIKDVEAGRVHTHAELKRRMKERLRRQAK